MLDIGFLKSVYEQRTLKHMNITEDAEPEVKPQAQAVEPMITLKSLEEIGKAVEDAKLPYVQSNPVQSDGFNLIIGVFPLSKSLKGFTMRFTGLRPSGDNLVEGKFSLVEEVAINDFAPVIVNTDNGSTVNDLWNLVESTDHLALFERTRDEALQTLKDMMPPIFALYNRIPNKRDNNPRVTLYVYYDPKLKMFRLVYSTRFIMEAAILEYYIERKKFKNFAECYKYTFCFLIAHEMSHIIRCNVDKGMMLEQLPHDIINQLEDSFINQHLAKILRGTKGKRDSDEKAQLVAGVGGEVAMATKSNQRNISSVGRILKKYSSLEELAVDVSNGLSMSIKRSLRVSSVSATLSANLEDYDGSEVLVKISCNDMSMFKNNSLLYNDVVSCIIKGITRPIDEEYNKKKNKKGPLVGRNIRNHQTGRVGKVIQDDGEGTVVVEYPPMSQDEARDMIEHMKNNGSSPEEIAQAILGATGLSGFGGGKD